MKKIFLRKVAKIFIFLFSLVLIVGFIFSCYFNIFATADVAIKSGELNELTTEQKIEDFNYLYDIFKKNHPYIELTKEKTGIDWLAKKDEFTKWIKDTKNNVEFYNALNKIVCMIQNGHTHIIKPEWYNEYKRMYTSIFNRAWASVLANKSVETKYKKWAALLKNENVKIIPINFKYVEGLYVATKLDLMENDFLNQYNIPQCSILNCVNGIKIDEYIKDLMYVRYLQYDNVRKKFKLNNLIIKSENDSLIKLTLLTPEGNLIERDVRPVVYEQTNSNNSLPNKLYDTAIIKQGKIAYLKVKSFDMFYVEKDRAGIYRFLKSIRNYPYLIIDIRGNGGGSEEYYMKNIMQPLLNKSITAHFYMLFKDGKYIRPFLNSRMMIFLKSIKKLPASLLTSGDVFENYKYYLPTDREIKPKNSVNFKGKIFLLVDRNVYSSAETFAAVAKATKWATIVGTQTGGDGIGIDPGLVALPNSGLIVRFPLEMGLNPDGTASEIAATTPDIYVEQTYKDFVMFEKYKKTDNILINPYDTMLKKILDNIR